MKKSEMQLHEIVSQKENLERIPDSLSEGIIAHDRERHILYFNRSAEEITGYSRAEVLGRDCHEVFGTPFCGTRCSFCDDKPDAVERLSYPIQFFNKKGEARRIEMEVSGVRDRNGRFVGVIAAFRDMTDLTCLKIETGALDGFAGIIGRHPKMLTVYRQIRDLATNDFPVHIMGDRDRKGTGGPMQSITRAGGEAGLSFPSIALPSRRGFWRASFSGT